MTNENAFDGLTPLSYSNSSPSSRTYPSFFPSPLPRLIYFCPFPIPNPSLNQLLHFIPPIPSKTPSGIEISCTEFINKLILIKQIRTGNYLEL